VTAAGKPLKAIPSNDKIPAVLVGPLWGETDAADERGIRYSEWFALPRWERAAMMAKDRLAARLEYWTAKWARGEGLPPIEIKRG
jgi:hypothetical protein